MQFHVQCPSCGIRVDVDTQLIGSQVVCGGCSGLFIVPATHVLPGMVLGDYWVQKRLGTGDLGDLFLAQETGGERRQRCLKVLSPAFTGDPEALQAFFDQVARAIDLEHRHLVAMRGSLVDDNAYILVMDYLEGDNLRQRLETDGALTEKAALRVALQVAEGLDYAWTERGLPHGNLKLANLLVDTEGAVAVTDLGVYGYLLGGIGVSCTPKVSTTLDYVSPELALGQEWDFRADIYSLGAIVYHLLDGAPPYRGANGTELAEQHVHAPLPDPRSSRTRVSDSAVHLVRRMMAKAPEDRHQTWPELIEALKEALRTRHATTTRSIKSHRVLTPHVPRPEEEQLPGEPPATPGDPRIMGLLIAAGVCIVLLLILVIILAARLLLG